MIHQTSIHVISIHGLCLKFITLSCQLTFCQPSFPASVPIPPEKQKTQRNLWLCSTYTWPKRGTYQRGLLPKITGPTTSHQKKRSQREKNARQGANLSSSGTSWDALRMPVAHEGLYIGIRDSYILKMKAFWVVIGMLGTSFVSQGTSISKKMLPFWGDTSWRRDAPTKMCAEKFGDSTHVSKGRHARRLLFERFFSMPTQEC